MPLGTSIGQAAGWRTTFLAVAVAGLGFLALLGLARMLPAIEITRDLGAEVRLLKAPQVWLTLAVSTLAAVSMFSFFTYVAPILTQVAGVAKAHVGFVLLDAGVGLTTANYLGARLADWRAGPSLVAVLVGVAAVGRTPSAATAIVTLWGGFAFAVCAITQAMAVEAARTAPNLASTLNISAFDLGNAIGAGLSAAGLSAGLGLPAVPLLAADVAALAATTAAISASTARYWSHLAR